MTEQDLLRTKKEANREDIVEMNSPPHRKREFVSCVIKKQVHQAVALLANDDQGRSWNQLNEVLVVIVSYG